MTSNPHQPRESQDPHPLETQLRRLKPVPVSMSAADILRECEEHAPSPSPQVHPAPLTNWSLLAGTGLAGVVIGVLLASTVFMSLQSGDSAQQAESNEPAKKPGEQPVAVDRPDNFESDSVAVDKQAAPIDMRLSEQLNDFQDPLNGDFPLSASSIVRPRLAIANKPADSMAFDANQPPQGKPKYELFNKPTIRSADSAAMLLELLDS